jgi:hypothetical protein
MVYFLKVTILFLDKNLPTFKKLIFCTWKIDGKNIAFLSPTFTIKTLSSIIGWFYISLF